MAATGPGAPVPISSGAQIVEATVCCYTVTDQIGLNVQYYGVQAVQGTGGTLGQFATLLDGVFAPLYKAVVSAGARYRGVRVRIVRPTPPSAATWDVANDGVGSVAGDLMPKQVSGIISFGTAFGGRGYRGRIYIPFPSETDNAATAVCSTGYVTGLGALLNAWLAIRTPGVGGNTSTMERVLYHKSTGGSTVITGGNTKTVWGTQRRRGSFGKINMLPF